MHTKSLITALTGGRSERLWAMVLTMLMLGCAATPSGHVEPGVDLSEQRGMRALELHLRAEVRQWLGTPHRWGGTSRRGVDCSGFIQRLYRDLFHYQIPRTTKLQSTYGKSIRRSQLMPGDVVFFKISFRDRHMGIYLGQSEFAHASSSKGVTISNLSNTYWQDHYWMSRRYLKY